MSELAFINHRAGSKVAAKEVSAVELLQMYLARVDTHNPGLNAICVDIREQAMVDAEAATQRGLRQSLVFFMASP